MDQFSTESSITFSEALVCSIIIAFLFNQFMPMIGNFIEMFLTKLIGG